MTGISRGVIFLEKHLLFTLKELPISSSHRILVQIQHNTYI